MISGSLLPLYFFLLLSPVAWPWEAEALQFLNLDLVEAVKRTVKLE